MKRLTVIGLEAIATCPEGSPFAELATAVCPVFLAVFNRAIGFCSMFSPALSEKGSGFLLLVLVLVPFLFPPLDSGLLHI